MNAIRDLMNKTSWGWIVALAMLPGAVAGCGRDDTDPPGGISGMDLHRDNATGCEYLSRHRGGLVPRIAADGKTHMGCKAVAP